MRHRFVLLLLSLVVFTASGCSRMNNTDKGALGGAVAGAATGALIALTTSVHTGPGMGIGALIGGVVGAVVGGHMDDGDDIRLQAQVDALTRERDDLLARLQACEGDRGRLEAELAHLNARISQLESEIARLNARNAELEAQLAARAPTGPARQELARYVIGNTILFGSGKADLTPIGRSVLEEAAGAIRSQYPSNNVVIEGHTDTVAISSSRWKSNWELGAARALAVLHYLEDNGHVRGERLAATTYSFYRPIASNDSSEGRSQNRRTEIVVYAD
jgi:chemotaxis protein MotB